MEINYDTNSFDLYIKYSDPPKIYLGHSETIVIDMYASGNVIIIQDILLCKDTLSVYQEDVFFRLKQLSLFSVLVESSTDYLQSQDTLFASSCDFNDFYILDMTYKDGLPDGKWLFGRYDVRYNVLFDRGKIMQILPRPVEQ